MSEEQQAKDAKTTNQGNKQISQISMASKILIFLLGIYLFVLSPFAVLFLLLGMLPGIVASMIDRRKGKLASKTVNAFNFIGLAPFIRDISMSQDPVGVSQQMLSDIYVWLLVYSAAGFGWVMLWIMPQITVVFFIAKVTFRVERLKSEQNKLIEEWGERVRGI